MTTPRSPRSDATVIGGDETMPGSQYVAVLETTTSAGFAANTLDHAQIGSTYAQERLERMEADREHDRRLDALEQDNPDLD